MLIQPVLPLDLPARDKPKYSSKSARGNANALLPEDAPVHNWYRFVLSFPPHLVRHYVNRFNLGDDHTLIDPFCGTGTTLVEAKKQGIPSVGIESIPMSAFATRTKIDWSGDPDSLVKHAQLVADHALECLSSDNISDNANNTTIDVQGLRKLHSDSNRLLIKNAISPLPLHKTLVLLEALEKHRDEKVSHYERLALARTLVQTVSNLKFGPEVGVGRIKEDAPVVCSWLQKVRQMADDLQDIAQTGTPSRIYLGDSRNIDAILEPESVDAVITSPPYPNEKDYTRTVRLESVLLGFMNDREELRDTKERLIRSNTRSVFKADKDDEWLGQESEVRRIASLIENRRIELRKTSGFERQYARVAELYFGGMIRHLRSIRKVLKPGAKLAYVVGDQASFFRIMIRTGELLADIAEREGFSVDGLDLFRTRPSTVTGEQLKEEVLTMSWRP